MSSTALGPVQGSSDNSYRRRGTKAPSAIFTIATGGGGIATDMLTLAAGQANVSASVLGLSTPMRSSVTVERTNTAAAQAAPRVSMVFPHSTTIEQRLRRGFHITGSGFASATEVLLGTVTLHREGACGLGGAGCFAVENDTEIVADGGDLTPGSYDVRVAGPNGESAVTSEDKVKLTSG
jgi:hypothetical protein